jgi:hypothetical protein
MPANGPAIKYVSVTQRSHPVTHPGALAGNLSRWQGGYGALFANPGATKLSRLSVAVQTL